MWKVHLAAGSGLWRPLPPSRFRNEPLGYRKARWATRLIPDGRGDSLVNDAEAPQRCLALCPQWNGYRTMASSVQNAATGAADEIAALAREKSMTIAVAESLTGGQIASRLSAASHASTWFRGSVVAYSPVAKSRVLGVTAGPVTTEKAAAEMAIGCRRMMQSDIAIAVTGVGGPGCEDGQEPGTACFALLDDRELRSSTVRFDGDPGDVIGATVEHALSLLRQRLRAAPRPDSHNASAFR